MKKELFICIFIIALIVIGNYITHNNTKESVETMSQNLKQLKIQIEQEKKDRIEIQMEEIMDKWYTMHDKLAYYIEHEELEKVDLGLVSLKTTIQTKEYEQGMEKLDSCIFLLEHIRDKQALKLVNIF